ncbi:MAG TPA: o-succinylbenzoate--CoA ligase [Polyangiaceae bacterium]|nr:o-succinylbenzoate--CoA ligase [Polyangiaceae bacterium]
MAELNVNIGHWVRKNARIYPQKIATKSGNRSFTYAQLAERTNRLANGLRALGLRKGDRVALLMLNGTEYVEAVFACSAAGFIAVPLNWRLGQEEISFILSDCAPKVLLHNACFEKRGAEAAAGCSSIVRRLSIADDGGPSPYEEFLATGDTSDAVDPGTGGDDPHLIMYTAGTTGNPKGVVLTHANCFWQSVNGWALGVSPETVALVLLPMFHVGGLNGSMTPMIHVGATVLLPPKFDVGETLATIQREKVSGMVAVPAVFQMMYDHPSFATTDMSSVQAFISGGAPLSYELIRKYHERGLEFRQGYGLTETSPGVTGMGPGECLRKSGTAGRMCLYVEVKIVDDDGRDLPTGKAGEVIVRGPNVMAGYWNRPEETAKALKNGWFHSGDIGYLDEDGYLTLVDRKKDMIISGGENVYPAEIEKVFEQHPGVAEVAVVGLPDAKWGEVPVAFVVVRPGYQLDGDELLKFCAERIAKYKTPKEVILREALPRNAAGKVLKPTLRREVSEPKS